MIKLSFSFSLRTSFCFLSSPLLRRGPVSSFCFLSSPLLRRGPVSSPLFGPLRLFLLPQHPPLRRRLRSVSSPFPSISFTPQHRSSSGAFLRFLSPLHSSTPAQRPLFRHQLSVRPNRGPLFGLVWPNKGYFIRPNRPDRMEGLRSAKQNRREDAERKAPFLGPVWPNDAEKRKGIGGWKGPVLKSEEETGAEGASEEGRCRRGRGAEEGKEDRRWKCGEKGKETGRRGEEMGGSALPGREKEAVQRGEVGGRGLLIKEGKII